MFMAASHPTQGPKGGANRRHLNLRASESQSRRRPIDHVTAQFFAGHV
jgi:hypothetical protein